MKYRDPLANRSLLRKIYVAQPYGTVLDSYIAKTTASGATRLAKTLYRNYLKRRPEFTNGSLTFGWKLFEQPQFS